MEGWLEALTIWLMGCICGCLIMRIREVRRINRGV